MHSFPCIENNHYRSEFKWVEKLGTHLFLLQYWTENTTVTLTKITIMANNPIVVVEIIPTKSLLNASVGVAMPWLL